MMVDPLMIASSQLILIDILKDHGSHDQHMNNIYKKKR